MMMEMLPVGVQLKDLVHWEKSRFGCLFLLLISEFVCARCPFKQLISQTSPVCLTSTSALRKPAR